MADPENFDSPQVKLVHECRQGFGTRDLGRIANTLHKDYRYVPYPKSLGQPEKTKEEWLAHLATIISLWTANTEPIFRFIVDTPGKVVFYMNHTVETSIGVENTRESIIIVHIVSDEDGSLKIKEHEEFTDSKAELDFVQVIAAAMAKRQ